MTIDLHTHSTVSDGTVPPGVLPALAKRAGLDVVALTDHDTLAGLADFGRASVEAGIEGVGGVEISCLLGTVEVHLLGYFVDPGNRPLTEELDHIRNDRASRAIRMVAKCREIGADITIEQVREIAGPAAIGRPHVAAALIAARAISEPAEAFTQEWIGDGGRADVPKHVVTAERAVELVRSAGGVAVLAHPRSFKRRASVTDEQLAGLVGAGLAGIEVDHPEHEQQVRSRLRGLAAELGILATGSSDFHGERKTVRLGDHTTPPEVLAALRAAATTGMSTQESR
ncbi:PHP domain-containing protein [Actinophytocola sediminis]